MNKGRFNNYESLESTEARTEAKDRKLIFDSGFYPRVSLLNRYTKELNAH